MTEREHQELINVAAAQWVAITVDDIDESDEVIILAASYEPASK